MRKFLIGCLAAMIMLSVLDSLSTYLILESGGKEVNPVMNWLMSKLGIVNALIFPKLICLLLLCYYTFKAINEPLSRKQLNAIAGTYVVLIGIYVIVVFHMNMPYLRLI